jgi:hypothetical protein
LWQDAQVKVDTMRNVVARTSQRLVPWPYNQCMHTPTMIRLRNPRLFNTAVYVTLTVTAVVSIIVFPTNPTRIASVVLCLAYGLVYQQGYSAITTPRQATLYFALQTLIVVGLLVLNQSSDIFGLLFFILSFQAVLVMPNRMAILWIVLFYLIDSGSAVWDRFPDGIVNMLFNIAVFFLTSYLKLCGRSMRSIPWAGRAA